METRLKWSGAQKRVLNLAGSEVNGGAIFFSLLFAVPFPIY